MRIMFDEIRNNKIKSFFLITLFVLIIAVLGGIIGFIIGNIYFTIVLAIVFSVIYFLISYYSGDRMILSMSGAKPVTKKEYPYLYHTIEGLAIAAKLPTPKAYVINDSTMNAFATGRDPKHASITVTTGLLEKMNRQELEGVVAHEMSHIKNFDIRLMMLTAVMVGLVVLLSDLLLRSFMFGGKDDDSRGSQLGIILLIVGVILAILSPIIGQMIQLAISRKREFMADASGAVLTRYPMGLANALKKIAAENGQMKKVSKATAHLFISSPFKKQKTSWLENMFSTHPSVEERIRRLEEM